MWTRKELKERAKEALKRNYWKAVLVSFLILMLGGGITPATAAGGNSSGQNADAIIAENDVIILENESHIAETSEIAALVDEIADAADEVVASTVEQLSQISMAMWITFTIVFIIVFFIAIAIIIAIDIFLINPLFVGIQRFMLKSVDGIGSIGELGFTFDHNYMNGVKTTFFRDLYITLWSFLFIIPGIYKKYQYYMVDYILAEYPDMPPKEVLECSKRMMDGHKWNTFVLNLSFILWHMLSVLTCGILEIFYVRPYLELTHAALYRTLNSARRNETPQPMLVDADGRK